jgi:hypothetical protein
MLEMLKRCSEKLKPFAHPLMRVLQTAFSLPPKESGAGKA